MLTTHLRTPGACSRLLVFRRAANTVVMRSAVFFLLSASFAEGQKIAEPVLYQLGPNDVVLINVKDEPEISVAPYTIDLKGDLIVPEIGSVHATGLTLASLQTLLKERCRRILKNPVVTVSIAEYRSQKIQVLGAVATPGVQQVRGSKTLYEAISEAGGLKPDAGGVIRITRKLSDGPLPLTGGHLDATGTFRTAEVDVEALMKGRSPDANIPVLPNDVITVAKAELVYVLGAVRRPGGFELSEKQNMTILEALSLAQGAERTAGLRRARILRHATSTVARTEIPVDLKSLMEGKTPDITLEPSDILVVPNSAAKSATYRALEAVVSTGSGVAIYHPF